MQPPFAVYIHWPFCHSKCPYCDFNSHVRDAIDEKRWLQALLRELERTARDFGSRRLTSLFFGGGTPSLMSPDAVAALIACARTLWKPADSVEITLEANPSTVEAGRFRAFAAAGVNRLSLGVQALEDRALAFLGRTHSARDAIAAIEMTAATFPRYSFDLIYGRPGQTTTAWTQELDRALALAGDHLSLYQLTIEPGTAFHTRVCLGTLRPPGDATAALYRCAIARASASGLPPYEISNYARPGGKCRHNVDIWRGADYAAIGPGAHGRLTRDGLSWAIARHRLPEAWLRQAERDRNDDGDDDKTPLTPEQRLHEILMTGLRLRDGLATALLEQCAAAAWRRIRDGAAMARLRRACLLSLDDDVLRASARGLLRLDSVLAHLLT